MLSASLGSSIRNNGAVITSSSLCPLFEQLSRRCCTDFGHLFLGSRCPCGWLPALTVTPSDGSHHCPVPPLPWGVQSSQAMCSSRLSVRVRPFRDTTPVKVAAASKGELRKERTRRLRVFHYQHCTPNMQILKYAYFPQLSHWIIFFLHILRIRFWVVSAFSFVSFWALLLGFFSYLYSNNPAFFFFLLFIGL